MSESGGEAMNDSALAFAYAMQAAWSGYGPQPTSLKPYRATITNPDGSYLDRKFRSEGEAMAWLGQRRDGREAMLFLPGGRRLRFPSAQEREAHNFAPFPGGYPHRKETITGLVARLMGEL